MNPSSSLRQLPPVMRGIVAAYTTSGVIHLVRPQVFEGIVPRALPRKRELVYASGMAELACAAGLLDPRSRRSAAAASAALLVAVLPGNVEMARQAHARIARRGSTPKRQAVRAATFARVPLQWPLIAASYRLARRGV